MATAAQQQLLQRLLDEAWAASSKASDSGSYAFQTHKSYDDALRDNRAAWNAWLQVSGAANTMGDPIEQDAQDRVEELDVAKAALEADKKARGVAGLGKNVTAFRPAGLGGGGSRTPASPYGAGRPRPFYDYGRGGSGGSSPTKTYALLAIGVAIAAKVAGLW